MKAKRLAIAAFLAAVVGALAAAFAPTGQVVERYGSAAGTDVTHSYSVSTFHEDGAWVLAVVLVPVLLTLVPMLVRSRKAWIVSTALLWIGCIAGLASVGMFFVPAAILMTIATSQDKPAPNKHVLQP
jgi:hypothetical protein